MAVLAAVAVFDGMDVVAGLTSLKRARFGTPVLEYPEPGSGILLVFGGGAEIENVPVLRCRPNGPADEIQR